MTTQEIKEKIHRLVDDSPEDKLEYVYSVLQPTDYSDDFKAILDNEFNEYQKNSDGNSREELNTMINTLMSKK